MKDRLEKKLLRKQKDYEVTQLMKEKRSEEYKVEEEVFDKPTLQTLRELIRRGILTELGGAIASGKESKIYWGRGEKGQEVAIKIFLVSSSEFRKGMLPYIEGNHRFGRIKRTHRGLVYAWATKEFKNLERAFEAGVRTPRPIKVMNNVLVMKFVGKNGIPYPLMKDVELQNPKKVYDELLMAIRTLYNKARIVHGDLSQYNVIIQDGIPVIIDISQAVLISHPLADELLKRDIRNINSYFSNLGVKVKTNEEVYEWVKS